MCMLKMKLVLFGMLCLKVKFLNISVSLVLVLGLMRLVS